MIGILFLINNMKQKLPVYWMHCKSCELLLDTNISKISWVKVKKISFKNNIIEFDIDNIYDLQKVKDTIKDLWYHLEKKEIKKNTLIDKDTVCEVCM